MASKWPAPASKSFARSLGPHPRSLGQRHASSATREFSQLRPLVLMFLSPEVAEQKKKGHNLLRWHCRFVAAVDVSYVLAENAGVDVATFEMNFSRRHPGVDEFMDAVIEVYKKYNGRPHLGSPRVNVHADRF